MDFFFYALRLLFFCYLFFLLILDFFAVLLCLSILELFQVQEICGDLCQCFI